MINEKADPNKVVIFADLLGFASLVEKYPIEVDLITAYDRPFSWKIDTIFALQKNHLTRSFTTFHHTLMHVANIAKMKHQLNAISFSDSVFFTTTYLFEAVNIAVNLLRSLLSEEVPVRIGIAYGSFEVTRFRSDITLDSGEHSTHFLGAGIVRSHLAENCGIKGIRILLHPSVEALLNDVYHNPIESDKNKICYLECPEDEKNNVTGVKYEIDYWDLGPTAEDKAWHALQNMWDKAPEPEWIHYQATAEAINRMRIKQGYKALSNLRRRTLPHRAKNVTN